MQCVKLATCAKRVANLRVSRGLSPEGGGGHGPPMPPPPGSAPAPWCMLVSQARPTCSALGQGLYTLFTRPFPLLWKWVWLARLGACVLTHTPSSVPPPPPIVVPSAAYNLLHYFVPHKLNVPGPSTFVCRSSTSVYNLLRSKVGSPGNHR